MPLLSGMMRSYAITGSTDTIDGRLAGRQAGRWAQQTVRAAFPAEQRRPAPPADPAAALRELTELRQLGVVTDAEADRLRARLGV